MDEKLRDLERSFYSNPEDPEAKAALVAAWERSGGTPDTLNALGTVQSLRKEKWDAFHREFAAGRDIFVKFLGLLFKDFQKLELATFISYVPHFMDGDPLQVSYSLLVSPRDYASHGIYPYGDIFENYTFEDDRADRLTLKPGAINGELTQDECENISNMLWQFYPTMGSMFGTNTRVDFKRLTTDTQNAWMPDGVTWERVPYDPGY